MPQHFPTTHATTILEATRSPNADALAAVASAPGPADDMERFRAAAARLMREPDPAARVVLMTELDRLRDPIRIEATTHDVLSDWDFTDSTHGGGSVDV